MIPESMEQAQPLMLDANNHILKQQKKWRLFHQEPPFFNSHDETTDIRQS